MSSWFESENEDQWKWKTSPPRLPRLFDTRLPSADEALSGKYESAETVGSPGLLGRIGAGALSAGVRTATSLNDFLGGVADVGTFGVLPHALAKKEKEWDLWRSSLGLAPIVGRESAMESGDPFRHVAYGAGGFAGFMLGPMKVGSLAGRMVGKQVPKMVLRAARRGLLPKTFKATRRISRVGKYAIHPLNLGIAEAVSDIPKWHETPERFIHGMKIGAIFAGAGMSHGIIGGTIGALGGKGGAGMAAMEGKPALSWLIRQATGRGLMALWGEYEEGYLSKENLPNAVFQECMNTVFLTHGVTPAQVLKGEYGTKFGKLILDLTKDFYKFNTEQKRADYVNAAIRRVEEKPSLRAGAKDKWGEPKEVLHPRDIYYDQTELDSKPRQAQIQEHLESLRKGLEPKDIEIEVGYNAETGQANALNNRPFLHALKQFNAERIARGESPVEEVRVRYTHATPESHPDLYNPLQQAALLGVDAVDFKVVTQMQNIKHIIYDTKADVMRPLLMSEIPGNKTKLNDYEIIFSELGEPGNWKVTDVGRKVATQAKNLDNFRAEFVRELKEEHKIKMVMAKDQALPKPDRQSALLRANEITDSIKKLSVKRHENKSLEHKIDRYLVNIEKARIKRNDLTRAIQVARKYTKNKDPKGYENKEGKHYEAFLKWATENGRAIKRLRLSIKNGEKKVAELRVERAPQKTRIDLEDIVANRMRKIRAAPLANVPDNIKIQVAERLKSMGMDIDVEQFFHAVTKTPKPKLGDLMDIEHVLAMMETAPHHERMPIMLAGKMSQWVSDGMGRKEPLHGEWARRQAEDDKAMGNRRARAIIKARKDRPEGGGRVSTLSNLLRTGLIDSMKDVDKWAEKIEINTGIPMWRMVEWINKSSSLRNDEYYALTDRLNQFAGKFERGDMAKLREYYRRKSGRREDPYGEKIEGEKVVPMNVEDLPTMVREFIKVNDSLMGEISPEVIRFRYGTYIQEGGKKGKIEVFKNQDKLKEMLDDPKVELAWVKGHDHNDWAEFDAWAEKHPFLGRLESGVYLPEIMAYGERTNVQKLDPIKRIDQVSTTHLQSREMDYIMLKNREALGVEALGEALHPDITVQVSSYVRHIMNAKHMTRPLGALDEMIQMFHKDFSSSRPKGLMDASADAKGMSALDYLKVYAHRAKGYPVKVGSIGRAGKGLQGLFFRSLIVRPSLWLRNLFQRVVTMPHRETMFDPRFMLRKGTRFKDLPEDYQQRFFSEGVDQMQAMRHHHMYLKATEYLKQIPGLKYVFTAGEYVGQVYSLTDRWNRKPVYAKTFHRSRYFFEKYERGEITMEYLEARLGLQKVSELTADKVRRLAGTKEYEEASFELAKWMSGNSQWKYRRQEKSLYEMTGEGEVMTNLFTWAKGITQQTTRNFMIMAKGMESGRMDQVWAGAEPLMGLMLTAHFANALMGMIPSKAGSKFSSYGPDMFMWEIGGVTYDMMKAISEGMGGVVTSFDGTPDERRTAMTDFIRLFDNLALRQLLPFYKNTISIAESMTDRSYISPIRELYDQATKGYSPTAKFVQRTTVERWAHAVMAQDPNKGAKVRRWNFEKSQVVKEKLRNEPRGTQYYKDLRRQLQILEYYNDVYSRYTPYETAKAEYHRNFKRYYDFDKIQSDQAWKRHREREEWRLK